MNDRLRNDNDRCWYMAENLSDSYGYLDDTYAYAHATSVWAAKICFNYIYDETVGVTSDAYIHACQEAALRFKDKMDKRSVMGDDMEQRAMYSEASLMALDIYDWYSAKTFRKEERKHANAIR